MVILGVCDDDIGFAKNLSNKIEGILLGMPDSIDYRIRLFTSANQLIQNFESEPINILLLDIDMPGMNGFEVAEKIQKIYKETIIIFVSAYDNFVYKSFQFNPFCFLRKAHLKEEIRPTIQNVLNRFFENKETMIFKAVMGDINIRLKDICYIECKKNYYDIHLSSGVIYTCRGTLSSIEDKMSEKDFFRIHKAFIVNMIYIDSLGTNYQIKMKHGNVNNSQILPVSMRKWASFKNAYMTFIRNRVIFA